MPPRGVAGLFGKLPARGDFVRLGLPRDFTDPWDEWWQRGILASREAAAEAGEEWVAAWLEAPVWRFRLPPGLMGAGGVTGVVMPSVDRAGRYYPLTVAAVAPLDWAGHGTDPFLDGAEAAGFAALERDAGPEEVLALAAAALDLAPEGGARPMEAGLAAWWTGGAPRVAPRHASGTALPEGEAFATLLSDGWAAVRS